MNNTVEITDESKRARKVHTFTEVLVMHDIEIEATFNAHNFLVTDVTVYNTDTGEQIESESVKRRARRWVSTALVNGVKFNAIG